MKKRMSYGDSHAPNLKAVIALNRVTNNLNRRAATIFRSHGLTMMQFAVLEVLYHRGDLKIGEIIEKILSTGGNMTVVLKNLIKDGFVVKCADPADSRASVISITDEGRRKIEVLFPKYLEDLNDFMKGISADEKKMLISTLKVLQKENKK